ncbi:hypothetical protein VPHD479_0118 [Vibrio phage D479]
MNHFELLGVEPNATRSEVKKRYRQLSTKLHPDKNGSGPLFVLLKNSYEQILAGNGARDSQTAIQQEQPKQTHRYEDDYIDELETHVVKLNRQLREQQASTVYYHNRCRFLQYDQAKMRGEKDRMFMGMVLFGFIMFFGVILFNIGRPTVSFGGPTQVASAPHMVDGLPVAANTQEYRDYELREMGVR